MTSPDREYLETVETENRELREAARAALNVLQQLVTPSKHHASAVVVWAQAVEAENAIRKALQGEFVS